MKNEINSKNKLDFIFEAFKTYEPYLYSTQDKNRYTKESLLFESEPYDVALTIMPWSFPFNLRSNNRESSSIATPIKNVDEEISDKVNVDNNDQRIKKIYRSNGNYPSAHLCDIDTTNKQCIKNNTNNEKKFKQKLNLLQNLSDLKNNKENANTLQNYEECNNGKSAIDHNKIFITHEDKLENDKFILEQYTNTYIPIKEDEIDNIYHYLCVCENPECTVTAFGNCRSMKTRIFAANPVATISAAQAKYFKNDFSINIAAIKENRDKRTTCMLKNIPNRYTHCMLKDLLDEHHYDKYDFLYLRIDSKNKCNVGYAFINFTNYNDIPSFYEKVSNKGWKKFRSHKIAELTYASIQGLISLVKKFRRNSFPQHGEEVKPNIWVKDPDILEML